PRLIADRNTVELRTDTLDIDLFAAQACVRVSAGGAATCDLAQAASSFRAPLLADLDLPANSEFHSWLLSWREDARKPSAPPFFKENSVAVRLGYSHRREGCGMPVRAVERKLTAILAADVAGYSRLMGADEVGTLQRLTACRLIVDGLIAAHHGRI